MEKKQQDNRTTEKRLVRAPKVAEVLDVSLSQVRKLTRTGKLPCFKIGRAVRYDIDAILQQDS
jgi:excisionase family DNA binding protein